MALIADGSTDESVQAFKVELATETKKPIEQQRFPLYVAEIEQEKFYIVPLRGADLNAIWGYIVGRRLEHH